jgi:hypothetical protein
LLMGCQLAEEFIKHQFSSPLTRICQSNPRTTGPFWVSLTNFHPFGIPSFYLLWTSSPAPFEWLSSHSPGLCVSLLLNTLPRITTITFQKKKRRH